MVVCHGRVDPFDSLSDVIKKLALVDLSDNGKDENDDLIVLKDGIEGRRQSNSSDLTESDVEDCSGEDNNSEDVNDDLEESAETDLESIVSIASASGNEESEDNNDFAGDDDSSDEDVGGEDPGPTKAPNSFKSVRVNDVHHSASPYARPTVSHGRVASGYHHQQNLNSEPLFPANNGYMHQVGCNQQLEFQFNGLQEKVQNSSTFLPTRQPSPLFGSEKLHLQVQPVASSGIQNFPSSFPEQEALVQTNQQQDANWQLDCPANDFLNQLMLSVGVGSDFEDISNLQGPSPSLASDGTFFANDFSQQDQQQQQDERLSPSFQIGSDVTCMSVQSQASTMECSGMALQPEIPTMIVPGTPSPFSVFSPCAKNYRRDSISQESHQDGGFSSSSGYEETNYFNDNCKQVNVAQQQQLSHQQHYQQMPLTPFSDQSEISSNGVNSPCQQLSPFSYGSASPIHQAVPEVVFTQEVSCSSTTFQQPYSIDGNFTVSAVRRDNSPVINMSRLKVSQQAACQPTSSELPKQGTRFLNTGMVTPFQGFDYSAKEQRPSTVATLSCQLPSRPQSLGVRYEVRDPIEGAILEFSQSLNPSLRRAMMAEIFSLPMAQIVTPSPGDNISLILAALRDRTAKKPRLEHIFALVMRLKAEHQLDVVNRPTYLNTTQLDSCYTYLHIFVLEAVKFALGNIASNGRTSNSVRVLEEDVKVFRFLLGCGASPYLKYNSSGDTLVHFMARLGDLTVPFLREIVQNPNVFDSARFFSNNFEVTAGWGQQGKTPLMVAREMDGQRSPFGHLVRTVEIQRLILSRMGSSSSS